MRRIYEQYAPGQAVEIRFGRGGEDAWQSGVVARRDPPGIWVRTVGGREWFVTNTYRIRPAGRDLPATSAPAGP